MNIRAGRPREEAELSLGVVRRRAREPKVKMKMSSATANKYFQGKENVPIAIARRRIKTGGDVKAALSADPDHQAGIPAATGRSSRRSTRISWPDPAPVDSRRSPSE